MKNKLFASLTLVLLSTLGPQLSTLFAQGTSFAYQGRLTDNGAPANGIYDLQFTLYDALTSGSQVGKPVEVARVAVSNGVFVVTLDFGGETFPGADRWLEIDVRLYGSGAGYTTLTPRQAITATPYAMQSLNAATAGSAAAVTGPVSASQLIGTLSSSNIGAGTISGSHLAPGAAISNIFASGQSAVGSGGVILSKDANSSVLAQAGYVKIPDASVSLANEAWKPLPGGSAVQSLLDDDGKPVGVFWTGSVILIWPAVIGGVLTKSVARYDLGINTWFISTSSNAPPYLSGSSVIWTGTGLIVWGGLIDVGNEWGDVIPVNSGARYNLSANSWTISSTNSAPSPRAGHTAVWTGTEMIIWAGGHRGPGEYTSGGRYNPASDSWVAMSTNNAPQPYHYSSIVWSGTEMIVWGGFYGDDYYEVRAASNLGARYNPAANSWTATSTNNAPSPRYGHSAVWTGSEMIIFGGTTLNYDTFPPEPIGGARYSPANNTWSSIPPFSVNGTTLPLAFHSAVWTGSEMLIWGGLETLDQTPFDEIFNYSRVGARYNLSGNSWSLMSSTNAPAGRQNHQAFWTGTEMFVWGGDPDGGRARYNRAADSWASFNPLIEPLARTGHSSVWTGSEMLLWGGTGESGIMSDGWRFNPATNNWNRISRDDNFPDGRSSHSAIWTGTEMIIWGGMASDGGLPFPVNSGGRYNPVTGSWMPMSTVGAPDARGSHTAVWTGQEMIVWGGSGVGGLVNTGGRYNPISNSWTLISLSNAPSARYFHTAVWAGNSMIVWGGYSAADEVINTGARYFPGANSWISTPTSGAPAARYVHTAVWTGSEMIIWGGVSFTEQFNNGGRFVPLENTWIATAANGAPTVRYSHTAVWTGDLMLVWGGETDGVKINTGSSYNPRDGTWLPMTSTGAPSLRAGHTAVWTGTQMVVWGGHNGSSYLNNGFSYAPQLKLYYYFRP